MDDDGGHFRAMENHRHPETPSGSCKRFRRDFLQWWQARKSPKTNSRWSGAMSARARWKCAGSGPQSGAPGPVTVCFADLLARREDSLGSPSFS